MKTEYTFIAMFLALSCNFPSSSNQEKIIISKIGNDQSTINSNLDDKIKELKKSMIGYVDQPHPAYTEYDVKACADILNRYRMEMTKTMSKEEGTQVVKATILELNKLNEKCGGTLIETGEREKIAEIIILAGSEKGYNTADDDITEPWREW
jgi:hypothetical protein